jgi:Cellulase (glycosyl hydrolase family 5)
VSIARKRVVMVPFILLAAILVSFALANGATGRPSTLAPTSTPMPMLLAAPLPCSPPSGTLAISICGNKWINQAGAEVVLKGANTEGTQYDCAQSGAGYFDDSSVSVTGTTVNATTEINALKAWGVNVVRVNLNEECWLGINGVPSTTSAKQADGYDAYADVMGNYVNDLNAAGIYTEVDLHLNAPGSELISDAGSADAQNPLPEANSDTFWKSVGTYFAPNHAVIFGIFNEPFPPNYTGNGDTSAVWNEVVNTGGQVQDCTNTNAGGKCSSTTYAGKSMQQMINDIRSVDTTTPLLAGGPDFAGDMDAWLNEYYPGGVSIDPSHLLAASVHIYFPDGNSPCSTTTNIATTCPSSGVSGGNGSNAIVLTAAKTPVLVDEVGDFGCSASSLTPFLASINSQNALAGDDIGWVGWSWTTSGCDPTMISSFTTGKPSGEGVAFYCDLYLSGLNNGSLTACAGAPPSTTTTTGGPVPTTTTTTKPPATTTTTTECHKHSGRRCRG